MTDETRDQTAPTGQADSDEALLAAVAARDKAAFAVLFARYAGRVKGFLIRAGLPDGEAEEAAQEVMISVWRRAASFDAEKAGAATWIFAIARNRRIELARRAARRDVDATDPAFAAEPAASAETDMAGAARDAAVRAAVETLGADQREAVRLTFFSGLTQSEIAERLGLPLGTVKGRLRLAFRKLRDELGVEFAEELRDD